MERFGGEIWKYSKSIHEHLKREKKQIALNGSQITLHSNTRIFMCSLTENRDSESQQIVESMAMPPVNIGAIALTLLSSLGFLTADSMAPKIAMLLELCGSLLTADNGYEFGHNVVTAMAVAAGEKLVEFARRNAEIEDGGDHDAEEKEEQVLVEDFEDDDALNAALVTGSGGSRKRMDEVEEGLIVEALVDAVYPMLTASDGVLFESLVESAFPSNQVDWNGLIEQQKKRNADRMQQRGVEEPVEYQRELRHLRAMGFEDERKCRNLLAKHNGDAELALQELFDSII